MCVCVYVIFDVNSISLYCFVQQPATWKSQSNLGSFWRYQTTRFGQSDQDRAVRVNVVWGLDDYERSRDCARIDFDCLATPRYTDEFDLSSHTAQNKLKVCVCVLWVL